MRPKIKDYDEKTSAERKALQDPKGTAEKIEKWYAEGKSNMDTYFARWATNLKLMKGMWDVDEKTRSEVRGRSKIFFRKIWSTVWRLAAALYKTYMKDSEQFRLNGRMGNDGDVHKAGVLQVMVEYYRDLLNNKFQLFIQFVWAFMNILTNGIAVGLFSWEYEKGKKDYPCFKVWKPEHVILDMNAELEHEMQYIIFESFLSMDKLKKMGLKNLDQLQPETPENTQLNNVRNHNHRDPVQNPAPTSYPSRGSISPGTTEPKASNSKYKMWLTFYRENGKVMKAITSGPVVLEEAAESKYGDEFPVCLGLCLTEPHKLIGEGWPEPLEGPQISLNDIINRRKDNVHQVMNKHKYVNRFANVDLSSLMNSRAGAVTLMDDVNAVRESEQIDVTQSAYVEAGADDAMMQEMSGVTPAKQGMEKSSKATIGQINLTESNEKIDLYLAIVGETWVKNFYQKLAYLTQRFATDEELMRVANKTYRKRKNLGYHADEMPEDVTDVDDFIADVTVDVGIGTTSRELQIQQLMLSMEKANQSNQSMIALLSTGAIPREKLKFFDSVKFMENLLPKLGIKNVQDYQVEVAPPPPENATAAPQLIQSMRGQMTPQMNAPAMPGIMNGGPNG